jgi:DNA-directed RNA polymerase subunit RPC12/RpoP
MGPPGPPDRPPHPSQQQYPSQAPQPLGPPPQPRRPQPPPLRATRQVTEQTRTYPCLQCGAQLVFDIRIQQLKCPACGNVVPIIEDAGRQVVEHDLRAAWGQQPSGVSRFAGTGGEVAQKEIVCQNCGGHTTFTGTLTAIRCPYCATPIQRDDVQDAPDRLPIDAVLPFRLDEPTARTEVDKWINGRWFAPSEFKKYNETGSFTSIYVAYFTFDATAVTDYTGQRGRHYTVTVGSGENQRTETRTDWTYVSGQVTNTFDDLPVLANTGLDEKKVEALEPWPTEYARPFSAEYVAGHLSRTYDLSVEQAFDKAKSTMEGEIDSTVRRDIGGDEQRVHSKNTQWLNMTFKHLLLPIWLLTVIYNGQPFHVCINGFTGEVQGRRPYSKVKIAMAVTSAVLLVILIVVLFVSMKGR